MTGTYRSSVRAVISTIDVVEGEARRAAMEATAPASHHGGGGLFRPSFLTALDVETLLVDFFDDVSIHPRWFW